MRYGMACHGTARALARLWLHYSPHPLVLWLPSCDVAMGEGGFRSADRVLLLGLCACLELILFVDGILARCSITGRPLLARRGW